VAVLPVIGPRTCGVPGVDSQNYKSYSLAQAAAFREADFVRLVTTGTTTGKTLQVSSGALLNVAGPVFASTISVNSTAAVTSGVVTVTGVVTAGAPAAVYYVFLTYTAAGIIESLPGPEFLVNCAAGYTFSVNVASGQAGATNFAAYVSTYEGGGLLQQATKTTTALGAAFTIPYPLTNSVGLNRAATGSNTSIAGIALHDSQSLFATGVGASFTAGNISNLFGAWANPPPANPIDPSQALVTSLTNGQIFEISLLQPWTNSLIGTAAGITLDSSGWFVADTTQSTFFTITGKVVGAYSDVGGLNDTYARVYAVATSGVI
jgi:hypothetical protein